MSIEDLALSDLWWYGPEILKNGNGFLVKADRESQSSFHDARCFTIRCTIMATKSKASSIMEKVSKNLLWLIRFITNVGRSVDGKIVGELLPSELKDAENWFIRSAQEESFAKDYRLLLSKVICLEATINGYGITRCNSRIV